MINRLPRSDVRAKDIRFWPLAVRQVVPLALVVSLFLLFRRRLPSLDVSAVIEAVQQVSANQWALAGLATLASFWAVGRYDQILHGLMDTGVGPTSARQSGAAAIAVAQFAGFGVLSSALVRWRLLPELTLGAALRISLAVSLSFFAGWAVVTAIVIQLTADQIPILRQSSFAAITIATIFLGVLIIQPARFPNMPTLGSVFAIIGLAFFDTLFAATALYVLLPQGIFIAPSTLFVAYLVALGCGLIGGTPGGVGPFELVLLAMLPSVPNDALLASALAFRIVYYVLPAGIAFIWLMRGPSAASPKPELSTERSQSSPYLRPELERVFWRAPRAEMNLVRQGQFALLWRNRAPIALTAATGQCLIMLTDPLIPSTQPNHVLADIQARAAQSMRLPIAYKCNNRTAVAARKLGWRVLPTAQEAWLRPNQFSLDGAKLRQLRRLLRKAKSANIRIVEGGRSLPLDDMQKISDQWALVHGGERGFSMGRFGRDYISCQRVFLAYQNETLVGFVTLHEVQQEWTLDLMRHASSVPTGTMHLLVCHAIESAAAVNCPRLSLAAVPCDNAADPRPVAWMRRNLFDAGQANGLRRFKACFDPHWSRLYAAAPGRLSLALGLWTIYARVNRVDYAGFTTNS